MNIQEYFFALAVKLIVLACNCDCILQDKAYGELNRLYYWSKILNSLVCSVCGIKTEDKKYGS